MKDDRLITRCSHCDTAFRVYEHQLMKREGQVRCGACGNIFNAFDTLDDSEADPLRIDGPQSLLPRETDVPVGTPLAVRKVDLPLEASDDDSHRRRGREAAEPAAAADAFRDGPLAEAEVESDPEPADGYLSGDGAEYDFGPQSVSRATRAARWAGALVLVLALVAQGLFWFRDDLAGRAPALTPLLRSLCEPVGCVVGLPRHAERIVIDSSELQTEPNGLLVLTATISNKAPYLQAQPLLELTLTDAREQPVVRKVLQPADYLEPAALSAGSLPAGADLVARVYLDAGATGASGYRLFVFYP